MNFKTAGESHGKALMGIVCDYPSGVPINKDLIDHNLARRQTGYGRGGRMAIESDKVEIISGVRKGISTGSPISFMIRNRDWDNWKDIMDPYPGKGISHHEKLLLDPRPGHADLTGLLKYRLTTIRDVIERSSARETAARVCTGSIALCALKEIGISIISYVDSIGGVCMQEIPDTEDRGIIERIEGSEVRCPDKTKTKDMMAVIDDAKKAGDSVGGSFRIIVKGLIPGLGSYTEWDKRLDARLAYALMSIPAVKSVEIGSGRASGSISGLDFHDDIFYDRKKGFYRKTNNAGGIEGGMSNGEDIVIGAVMKPVPTTAKGKTTVNIPTKKESMSLKERSDVCAVPSAAVVGEAVTCIELLDAVQEKFGSDSIIDIKENLANYLNYVKSI